MVTLEPRLNDARLKLNYDQQTTDFVLHKACKAELEDIEGRAFPATGGWFPNFLLSGLFVLTEIVDPKWQLQ